MVIISLNTILLGLNSLFSYQGLVIFLIILLLFGGRKIPELMKGLGKGVRSFKEGLNEAQKELDAEPKESKKEEAHKEENRKD